MLYGDGKAKLVFHDSEKKKDAGEFGAASAKALCYRAGRCLTCAQGNAALGIGSVLELGGGSGVQRWRSWAVRGNWGVPSLPSSSSGSRSRWQDLTPRAGGCDSRDAGRVFICGLGSVSRESKALLRRISFRTETSQVRGWKINAQRAAFGSALSPVPCSGTGRGGRIGRCFLIFGDVLP